MSENEFNDNATSVDWSKYDSDQRAQIPTTDRIAPPPPVPNSGGDGNE